MTVMILPPVYNRRGRMNLYQSLCEQTVNDFEWLIVDDGSTDELKKMIYELQDVSEFPIRYVYKENGGKHTALNVGIETIQSKLTFIVDSDDCVTSDAIEKILKYEEKYEDFDDLCGFAFLREFPDGKINGKLFKPDEKERSYIDERINPYDTNADKAEVFKTRCLKEFPFPIYGLEKFLGEDIVWVCIARKYKMIHINKAIYVGSYQEDGLMRNRRVHNIESPVDCMNRANEFLYKDIKMKYRIKASLQMVVYGKFAGEKLFKILSFTNKKLLTGICVIPGMFLYNKWKKEYEEITRQRKIIC